jgi:uncharacterized membrane protein
MSTPFLYLLVFGIGFVAGLRALTAVAVTSWAARLGWLDLHGSSLAFMGSNTAVLIFSLLAVGEYVGDLLPQTPSRTKPGPLIARILMGGLSGACFAASADHSLLAGAVIGGIGAVAGTFAGYQARTRLVKELKVKDAAIAIPEDIIAIGVAYLLVSLTLRG